MQFPFEKLKVYDKDLNLFYINTTHAVQNID